MLSAAPLSRGRCACLQLQKKGAAMGFGSFLFPCRSLKSCSSVMNIHFNVVLKIQRVTSQRENDPGIKEINI